jgi:hypothetical protein
VRQTAPERRNRKSRRVSLHRRNRRSAELAWTLGIGCSRQNGSLGRSAPASVPRGRYRILPTRLAARETFSAKSITAPPWIHSFSRAFSNMSSLIPRHLHFGPGSLPQTHALYPSLFENRASVQMEILQRAKENPPMLTHSLRRATSTAVKGNGHRVHWLWTNNGVIVDGSPGRVAASRRGKHPAHSRAFDLRRRRQFAP